MSSDNFSVSSVVVMCMASDVDRLCEELNNIESVEWHYKDDNGKIVITMESSSIDEEIKILKQVESLKGVISAQMMYSYSEQELQKMRENIDIGEIPEILQNDKLKAEDIVYYGDVSNNIDNILKK
ncbi:MULTISPECIES: chaperone NapD [Helicobacter]|uniref:Chaperone NapD n=1 Tax=Helicobacter ibis TaxID=2962633 RepID=A0ABT4VCT7_9HELI|nr:MULTISPECIES: chaperone NapD [Helicobacter]MDA3966710.1 chaperone NapD [Helicobacter sp. WB40]MDA3968522.1 chaperone NapD [Helicobacter ibis]